MIGAKMSHRDLRGARWNGDRDRRILHALGRTVLLTVAQVQRVGPFGSREAAARRMRKLAKLGYVRIWKPRDKTEPARYGVTEIGKERLLEEDDGVSPERIHVAKGTDRRDLDHLAQCADVRIAVGLASDRRSDLSLVDYLGEADLRQLVEENGERLLPDAFFILETVTPTVPTDRDAVRQAVPLVRELGVWIEVDRGTEGVRRFVEKKLALLAAHLAAGSPVLEVTKWTVLALVERERRGEAVSRLAAASSVGGGIWIATIGSFLADPFGLVLQPTVGHAPAQSLPGLLFQRGVPSAGTGAYGECLADARK